MMDILICEDNPQEAEQYREIIRDYLNDLTIKEERVKGKMRAVCHSAEELLSFLDINPVKKGLYFLDICLGGKMNGLQLAVKIRQQDPLGSIVFLTSKSEMSYLTFQYQVEALDFIIKDQMEEIPGRIRRCISKASVKYREAEKTAGREPVTIRVGGAKYYLEPGDIMYIRTSRTFSHKVEVTTKNGVESFYGTLKEFAAALSGYPEFVQCHQSVLVNRNYIVKIEKTEKLIEMKDGMILPVSVRFLKKMG